MTIQPNFVDDERFRSSSSPEQKFNSTQDLMSVDQMKKAIRQIKDPDVDLVPQLQSHGLNASQPSYKANHHTEKLPSEQPMLQDIEFNRKGFRGMKNRPHLRNLNDTRKDRIVRVARNQESFEKFATSQKKDQNISIEQQEEQHQFYTDHNRIGSQE